MIEIKNISTSKKAQTISFLATNEVLGDLNNSKTERLRYIFTIYADVSQVLLKVDCYFKYSTTFLLQQTVFYLCETH